MKKIIYVAKVMRGGDEFDIFAGFDKSETVETATDHWNRQLTSEERKNSNIYVEGYNVEFNEGMTAKEAYTNALLEGTIPSDSVEYIQIGGD